MLVLWEIREQTNLKLESVEHRLESVEHRLESVESVESVESGRASLESWTLQ